jgi:hypothetical protein
MNYYKQGDAARAEEIKAAFEKLGYDVSGFDMCNDNILFFTYKLQGGGKVISTTNANLYTANIIKTHPDYKELELPKPHYDIKNFHAGMPVLVRADNVCRWDYSVFSRITGNEDWQFAVCNGVSVAQCIPFNEETKHLLGTTDMCDEMYINW